MLEDITVSSEVARAARSTRSESDARTSRAAQERKLIERSLPPGKTYTEAVERATARKRHMWSALEWMLVPEDDRIEDFQRYCVSLCQGNRKAGEALAMTATWA